MKVLIACIECGKVTHAPWPDTADDLGNFTRTLWRECQFVLLLITTAKRVAGSTVLTATPHYNIVEGPSKDVVMAPICVECARRIHGAALIEEVEKSFGDAPQTKRSGD